MSNSKLKRLVDDIENLDATIKQYNDEKAQKYKDAKNDGYDIPALKTALKIRRDGLDKHTQKEELISIYLAEIG